MFAVERQKKILELLNLQGSVAVNELGRQLDVTVETIRRDLEKLEQLEQVTRTHGGAVLYEESALDLSSEKRSVMNREGKIEIAKKAILHIQPGDTVFLDGSTTSCYLAKLVKELKNITVITNSLDILNELSGCDKIKLISTGGALDINNKSFVGEISINNIRDSYCAAKVFFSSKGVIHEKGILESSEAEYRIKRAMIENSQQKYFLADKSKIGRIGFIKLANFSDIDFFVSDKEPDNELKSILKKNKVKIL